jgi:hypothetical protein
MLWMFCVEDFYEKGDEKTMTNKQAVLGFVPIWDGWRRLNVFFSSIKILNPLKSMLPDRFTLHARFLLWYAALVAVIALGAFLVVTATGLVLFLCTGGFSEISEIGPDIGVLYALFPRPLFLIVPIFLILIYAAGVLTEYGHGPVDEGTVSRVKEVCRLLSPFNLYIRQPCRFLRRCCRAANLSGLFRRRNEKR